MNENTKTVAFVAVAAVVVLIVWLTQPVVPLGGESDVRGKPLFPNFEDPLAATSLEIVKYDEDTAEIIPFKVALIDGAWSIPSHDNYPADAKDQLAEAAASLMHLKILGEVTDNPGDFEQYGVVDPGDKDLDPGATGVGMRVTMKDKDDKPLLALVIGKMDPEQPNLRFVRRVDQNSVYSVALSTDKLTTRFESWIEKDLLKLNPWDIKRIDIQDYSIDEVAQSQVPRGKMTLTYDDAGRDERWKLVSDLTFGKGNKWVPVEMADDEQLDTKKLDDMKLALDDLKIVDVARKPPGLSADLKAAKSFLNDRQAVLSLAGRGFYLATVGVDGKAGIFSNEGEIRCLMKDGVEYVLRFGNIAGAGAADDDKDKNGPEEDKTDAVGMNRYIFVMAEFNPDAIPKPKLEPLPEQAPPEKTEKPDAEKPDAEKPDAEKPDEAKPDEAKPDDQSKLKLQREQIEKENKRKQEQYDEKIAAGKKKVKELNARFADWYYVISESVYKQIHLGRDDIVKKKEKPEGEDSDNDNPLDAFEKLKREGPGSGAR
jgi:hypothetical protein